MVKRKAEEPPQTHDLANRRRTRSSGLLSDAQQTPLPVKRRRRALPVTSSPKLSDSGRLSKENNANEASADELDLLRISPSKANAEHASPSHLTSAVRKGTGTPRQIIDAVVITTPKSILRTPQKYFGRVSYSPSPSRPRNIGKGSPNGLPNHTRKYLQSRSPRKPPATLPGLSSSASFSPRASPKRTLSSPSRPTATERLPRPLPSHLVPHLHFQKKAVLHALQNPPLTEHESSPYPLVFNQLTELVNGTTQRHEGNSCLILGPRGSGKSRLVDGVLASVASTSLNPPVIVRLSAHCQSNDRLAMREIARQIQEQQGSSLLPCEEDEEDSTDDGSIVVGMGLPPSSQLPGMMAALPGLGRPVIVVLDGFDGFAAHARQALLYCLLDTVQSCRGGSHSVKTVNKVVDPPTIDEGSSSSTRANSPAPTNSENGDDAVNTLKSLKSEHGLLVIGITSRVDCLTLLEKRVKSRFSHRIMRVGTPSRLNDIFALLRAVLHAEANNQSATAQEWKQLWAASINEFLADKDVLNALKEIFAFGKDLRILFRLLISPVAVLTPNSPWLVASQFISSVSTQRSRTHFPFLTALPYPHVALLIAAAHIQTAGHDTFNFEMLYDKFITQVRVSVSAPVQVERGGLGMVSVTRGVTLGAFEQLIANRVFQPVAAPSTHITKEFVKYRCMVAREELKGAVEHLGQTNLKKWFSRNQ